MSNREDQGHPVSRNCAAETLDTWYVMVSCDLDHDDDDGDNDNVET